MENCYAKGSIQCNWNSGKRNHCKQCRFVKYQTTWIRWWFEYTSSSFLFFLNFELILMFGMWYWIFELFEENLSYISEMLKRLLRVIVSKHWTRCFWHVSSITSCTRLCQTNVRPVNICSNTCWYLYLTNYYCFDYDFSPITFV